MELDDYPVGLLLEDLSHCPKGTGIYFYDDDSQEYYGIYPDEIRKDEKGSSASSATTSMTESGG